MNFTTKYKRFFIILFIALILGLVAFAPPFQGLQRFRSIIVSGDANLNHLTVDGVITLNGGQVLTESFTTFIVSAPTAVGTATPVAIINTEGGLSNLVELRKNGTPIAVYNKDGGYTTSGASTLNGGASVAPNLVVAAPTGVGTATPVAMVNTAGGLSNLFEARAASTPQFVIGPAGAVTVNQAVTENGGSTNNAWAKVAAPTAIATATPAAVIDSAGVSNILEVRDAATPVFQVRNGGTHSFLNGEVTLNATSLDLNDTYIDVTQDTENIGLPTVLSTDITYTAAAGGTGAVATIGDGEIWIVHKVLVRVTTNFDATGDDATLVIGDGGDADGFIVLADAELQAADTEGTGFAAGWQGQAAATIGAYLDGNENGFVYAPSGAPETIDYLIDETSGETLAAGEATVIVIYTRIQ